MGGPAASSSSPVNKLRDPTLHGLVCVSLCVSDVSLCAHVFVDYCMCVPVSVCMCGVFVCVLVCM